MVHYIGQEFLDLTGNISFGLVQIRSFFRLEKSKIVEITNSETLSYLKNLEYSK